MTESDLDQLVTQLVTQSPLTLPPAPLCSPRIVIQHVPLSAQLVTELLVTLISDSTSDSTCELTSDSPNDSTSDSTRAATAAAHCYPVRNSSVCDIRWLVTEYDKLLVTKIQLVIHPVTRLVTRLWKAVAAYCCPLSKYVKCGSRCGPPTHRGRH